MPPKFHTAESPQPKEAADNPKDSQREWNFYNNVRVKSSTIPLGSAAEIQREGISNPEKGGKETAGFGYSKELQSEVLQDLENGMVATADSSAKYRVKTEAVSRPAENDNEQLPKERAEYHEARSAWEIARKESDACEAEFRSRYEDFVQQEESKKFAGLKRWFGIEPELPKTLEALREKSLEARASYKRAAAKLKDAKFEKEIPGTAELGPKTKEAKILERYERMLAQKLVLSPIEERMRIQREVIRNLHPHGSKIIEWARSSRNVRIAGVVAAYSLIGFATGGIGAALLAGGGRAGGYLAGIKGGAFAGAGVREFLNQAYVRKREESYEGARTSAKEHLFDADFRALEEEVRGAHDNLKKAERNTRVASAGAAMVGGAVAGGGVMNALEDAAESVPEPVAESLSRSTADAIPGEHEDTAFYEVQKGDSLWNILEGDVSGREMSGVLSSISEGERNEALSELFRRVDSDPALREAIGMKSASANVISAGEELNIAALEEELSKIASEKGYVSFEGEATAAVTGTEAEPAATKAGTSFAYEPVDPTDDPEAGEDPESITPPPETIDTGVRKLVEKVETNRSGLFRFLDGPNIEGTYDAIRRLKLFEIISLQGDPDALERKLQTLGIREEGWDKWIDAINAHNERLPFDRGETLERYLERIAKADIPPKDVE